MEWGGRYIDSNAMMRQLHFSAVQLRLCHNGGLGRGVIATLQGKRGYPGQGGYLRAATGAVGKKKRKEQN